METDHSNQWPSPLSEDAFYGIAGKIIKAIEPHTETAQVATLLQFHAIFGNIVGRNNYFQIEKTKHFPNIFVNIVGSTSRSRKGTSLDTIMSLFRTSFPEWHGRCVKSGLSSGEGLIWNVRDPDEDHGDPFSKPNKGVLDKRLLITETEFGSTLKILRREGNILSAVIRNAWDGKDMNILTKNSPAKATDAHISLIGHITQEELNKYLDGVECANGFGNRFIWASVKRSKRLPFGSNLDEDLLREISEELSQTIEFAKTLGPITFASESRSLWSEIYNTYDDDVPGIFGAMTARAEPQIIRIATLYALQDQTNLIKLDHLKAALAVWNYSEASCRYLFGKMLGDPVSNKILSELKKSAQGLTLTEISERFGRNLSHKQIQAGLSQLSEKNIAYQEKIETGHRPIERWFFGNAPTQLIHS